ncbi:hypothetical protein TNCT6_37670 [Streptomyces sp. 6-11-2]|nr:hypothetical protein TNCT6_37670 [Streptomyces sp. 6-11-2]
MPRFSIVVPSHGVAGRLSLALDSVLAQSFGDFELIAVCDGPAAPAAGVAADHAGRDSRVVLVHSPPSAGLGAARNAGTRAASGTYLLFLDGDDTLVPGALSALAARLEETGDVDVLYFEHERTPWWDGEPATTAGPPPVTVRAPAFSPAEAPHLTGVPLPAWSAVYRRSFVTGRGLAFPDGHRTDVGWGGLVAVAAERVAVLRRVVVRHLLRRQGSRLEGGFWLEWLRRHLWQPVFAALLAAGAWGALRRRGAFGLFVAATAFTGFLTQAAHPDITVWGERLIVLAWLLPVVGVPLLLERVVPRPAAGIPGPRTGSRPDEWSPVPR